MRTSRRTYKPRALDKSIVEVLKNMVDAVNEASGLEFQFIEDGNPPFKIFTGKFSYIAVCGEDTEKARIKSGYWGESIVLQCVFHGLGTCWVCNFDASQCSTVLGLPEYIEPAVLIPVGYAEDEPVEKKRKMLNEILF